MASFFFQDYDFPSELYNRQTGDFTTPVRTLLDFAPHILEELPKPTKDQKPIHSNAEDTWTNGFVPTSYLSSILTSERTRAITEFVMRCGNEYLKSTSDKRQREEEFKRFEAQYKQERRERRRKQQHSRWFGAYRKEESSSSEEDEEETDKMKEQSHKEKKEKDSKEDSTTKKEQSQVLAPSYTATTLAKSAAAAGALSLSLYSTYQASVKFNEVSFHNQLEILITQVQSIIQSTEVWIEEHDKMDDKIPTQVRTDLVQLKQLVDFLVRLDARANKKKEAAGWGCGALGGVSVLGGVVLGSTAAVMNGAGLVISGALIMISSKASGKSQLGARLLLENQVRERVAACQQSAAERKRVMQEELGKKEPETVTPSRANGMNSVKIDTKQEKETVKKNRKSERTANYVLESV